ncbi:protein hypothetical protein [Limosa lapponica baueri]|uniref:Uncharacterized protein n=1 Tax=Limosa lapponica baueri TaxID=1758121 RepID=A0A2I0T3D7_LIMLA|nr:protein hypothetical protein [Limosa lapponica baueri]
MVWILKSSSEPCTPPDAGSETDKTKLGSHPDTVLAKSKRLSIFDIFIRRLQDCNKKVNQQALEVLASMIPILGGALHPVLISLVAAVTENLNSKHLGIHSAAMKVLEASTAHLGKAAFWH